MLAFGSFPPNARAEQKSEHHAEKRASHFTRHRVGERTVGRLQGCTFMPVALGADEGMVQLICGERL